MKYLDKVKLLFLVIILIADGRISVWSQEIRELTFSNISSRSVVVSWLTDEAVSSQVEYGQTLALGQIREDLILKMVHNLKISGHLANGIHIQPPPHLHQVVGLHRVRLVEYDSQLICMVVE